MLSHEYYTVYVCEWIISPPPFLLHANTPDPNLPTSSSFQQNADDKF